MSKKNQKEKKKQTKQVAVNVEVNKSKSSKSLESFVKASLGALLSFGITGLHARPISASTLETTYPKHLLKRIQKTHLKGVRRNTSLKLKRKMDM